MNGEQEMVNKYHKKSVEVFNESLTDEMRGLAVWGWPCENTSLISDKLISLNKINFNLQTVEMWRHSQTEQRSAFISGGKRFCWSGRSDSSLSTLILTSALTFSNQKHIWPPLPPPSSLPPPLFSPLLPFSRLYCISWLFVDLGTPAAEPQSLLPPHIMNIIILNYKAFLSRASPSQLEPFNLLICSS